ncbi:hypothetical protein BJX66DRAFT_316116, partial [Aspergillus keveii]
LLSKQSQSPSSPSKRALDELIKGYELAIDTKPKVQGATDHISLKNEQLNQEDGGGEEVDQTTPPTLEPRKRAPPTRSECNIQGHIRTRCPNRRTT